MKTPGSLVCTGLAELSHIESMEHSNKVIRLYGHPVHSHQRSFCDISKHTIKTLGQIVRISELYFYQCYSMPYSFRYCIIQIHVFYMLLFNFVFFHLLDLLELFFFYITFTSFSLIPALPINLCYGNRFIFPNSTIIICELSLPRILLCYLSFKNTLFDTFTS